MMFALNVDEAGMKSKLVKYLLKLVNVFVILLPKMILNLGQPKAYNQIVATCITKTMALLYSSKLCFGFEMCEDIGHNALNEAETNQCYLVFKYRANFK